MTILVAYVARPEGQAALDKGIEIATRRNEPLVVINAGPGGRDDNAGVIDGYEGERIADRLEKLPVKAEFKHFVRGKSTVEEIEDLVAQLAWPETVDGVALSVERSVLPPALVISMGEAASSYLAGGCGPLGASA